jgi:hypothetical protein
MKEDAINTSQNNLEECLLPVWNKTEILNSFSSYLLLNGVISMFGDT